ncbi:MAG: ABC transporter ATP-binding protein [Sulfolobales archaeon]|nr:ABC transporter ATP-binding protein [Sulfolobales archaeon]
MESLVRLKNVTVRYRSNGRRYLTAVSNVDLGVSPGEFVAVVGRSGCGKTTLLKVVAGLIKPDEGEVAYSERFFNGSKKKIGVMFQSPLLLPWRNVLENILLPIEIIGEDPANYVERALILMERTGLRGFEYSYPWELSGGMQQRVALCRALIHRPQLLLLDEPFSSLDAITREEMWVLLESVFLYENYTTLLVTHDIREAVLLSDRVVVMSGKPGRVKTEVEIPFKRPRNISLQYSKEFNEYVAKIKSMLSE